MELIPSSMEEIEAFVREFEACTLPKSRWHHHAHLVVGLWYLSRYSFEETLAIVRRRIRAYNEVVGPPNTDTSGYHETLTRFYLLGMAEHIGRHRDAPLPESLGLLLASPLASKDWPLAAYSRDLLASVAARRQWVEPDLPRS